MAGVRGGVGVISMPVMNLKWCWAVFFALGIMPSAPSGADELTVGGVNLSMNSAEIQDVLIGRGMTCVQSSLREIFPHSTGGVSRPLIDEVSACVGHSTMRAQSELSSGMNAHIENFLQIIFAHPYSSLEIDAVLDDPRFAPAVRGVLAFLEDSFRTADFTVAYQVGDRNQVIFSCARFGACTRPLGEIISAMRSDIEHDRFQTILARPQFLSDLFDRFSRALSTDPLFANFLPHIAVDTLNFPEQISTCISRGDDMMCIYDGEIVLEALSVLVGLGNIPRSTSSVRLLSSIRFPIRLMWMERNLSPGGAPSFR